MKPSTEKALTISAGIHAPIDKVWECFTSPQHIMHWNQASPDWHTTRSVCELKPGGKMISRMEARDGSVGFDFEAVFNEVVYEKKITYTLVDGRDVEVLFSEEGDHVFVTQRFVPESENPIDMQQAGWQAILDNFKVYAETAHSWEPLHFDVLIQADADHVYRNMIDADTYSKWTRAFNTSSYYQGSWEKGSKILFLGVDKDGNKGGMVSRIKENIPNEFISIEHLGIIQNGKEITKGPEVDSWNGALENYSFIHEGNRTRLSIDIDCDREFISYFSKTWPEALELLKSLCEDKGEA